MLSSMLQRCVLLLALVAAAPAVAQTTVTLRDGLNGYAGTRDNDALESLPDTNRGTLNNWAMNWSTGIGMVRFAIFAAEGGPVPDGATITSATLSVYQSAGPTSTWQANRMLKDWQETQATWNIAATGLPWQTAGARGSADINTTADSQFTIGTVPGWVNFDVTPSVQAFAGGTANYGWRVGWVSGTTGGKTFYTRENANASLRPTLTVTYTTAPSCTSGPFGGTPWPVGEIEAENFDCGGDGFGYHDLTAGNQSTSTYRPTDSVDIMDMTGGGRTVQFFDAGEWMSYTINVATAGYFNFAIYAASNWVAQGQVAGKYSIDVGGASTGSVDVMSTGSWDVYQWTTAPVSIFLSAGTHVVKVNSVQSAYRIDKIRLEPGTQQLTCEDPPQRAFAGTIQVPAGGATFEAENYDCGGQDVAYHDNVAGNQSTSQYRAGESVDVMDITPTTRTVQFFDTGEWMEYTINIASEGDYKLGIYAASNQVPLGQIAGQYSIDVTNAGTNEVVSTGNVNVQSTGDWTAYAWTDGPAAVHLKAGTHTLRLNSVQQSYRVDKLHITPPGGGGGTGTIDPNDIKGRARADIPFANQSGWNTQVMNQFKTPPQITEQGNFGPGIYGPMLSNGETIRFGQVPSPLGSNTVLAFQLSPNDPDTSSSKRAELKFDASIEYNKVYWIGVKVYVNFTDFYAGDNTSLFGTQMHSGTSFDLSPSFGIYFTNNGANFEIQARRSTGSGSQQAVEDGVQPTWHYANQPTPMGTWMEFVFRFKHNINSGVGFLQVWKDRVKIVDHSGGLGWLTPGVDDYAKFGYYNWGGGFTRTRKVWLHSPVVVADPTGSKYTEEDLHTFLNQ